jgi:hypothetical protein
MTVTDVGVVLSFLAIVIVIAKMLRAFRLLEARVSLLQEQIERNHGAVQRVAVKAAAAPRPPARTPVLGVPVTSSSPTSRPALVDGRSDDGSRPRGESAGEPTDDEVAWAFLAAEQERLKKAMGRDFQARRPPRLAAEVRGTDVQGKPGPRVLSAREVAAKLERK